MRVTSVLVGVSVAVALASAACGGSSGYNNGGAPAPSPGPSPAAVTVNIVGSSGDKAFTPNPASPGAALTVAWKNADGTTHRIVANDGSFDTGNLASNATSATINVPAEGLHYHCAIHPTMIGAINGSAGSSPPCTGQYC